MGGGAKPLAPGLNYRHYAFSGDYQAVRAPSRRKERLERRMTWTDRLVIEKLFNYCATYRAIADSVGFTPAAVYREVQRGLYNHD